MSGQTVMEKGSGSAFHCVRTERRKSVFRKLITSVSEHLQPEEVAKCSFICNLPKDRSSSALHTLEYLMQAGEFSHCNVEPLVKLLKDINRHDLVNELVEPYLNGPSSDDELFQSLPAAGATQHIPTPQQSPPDMAHTIHPTSLVAVQESEGFCAVNKIPAPSLQVQQTQRHDLSPAESLPTALDGEEDTNLTALPLKPRIYNMPVKWQDGSQPSHEKFKAIIPPSNSSSCEQFGNHSSNNLLEPAHTVEVNAVIDSRGEGATPQRSVATPTDTPTTTHINPSQKKGSCQRSTSSHGLFTTSSPLSASAQQTIGTRSMSESRAQRSMTPPPTYNKRVSEPNVLSHVGHFGPFNPPKPATMRPGSRASHWSEASQPSPIRFLAEANHGEEGDIFSTSQLSSQPDGIVASPLHTSAAVEVSTTLFRKRARSKKKILSTLTRHRDQMPSVVSWSVKRKKLNEPIYEHRKEKLLKFPQELELETGGKHPPRLTLYLHPYGYEEDAQENLTLAVTLDISVKCLISSSAMIRVEVVAKDSSSGEELKRGCIDCSADCRIARCKSFLSHRRLRELECESIDFVASAKLYNAGLTD